MKYSRMMKLGIAPIQLQQKKKTYKELMEDKDLNNKLDQLSEDDLDDLWEHAANDTSQYPDCPYTMDVCSFLSEKLNQRQID